MKRTFAGNVVIDHITGQIYIDGVRIPWWLEGDGPTVDKVDGIPVHIITLPIYADGIVTIIGDDGSKTTYDPVLGNVREWAANFVRKSFAEAYPSLNLPQEAL